MTRAPKQPRNKSHAPPSASAGSRWAEYAGFLMIILDQTIVNVALHGDPGRSALLAVEPGLGGQRVPDRLRVT